MSFQAYLDNIEAKTGKTPQQLIDEASEKGFGKSTKAGEILKWLTDDYDLGRGHGMAIVYVIKNGAKTPDKYVNSSGTHSDLSNILKIDGMKKVQIRRIYEEPSKSDGYRALIDRLWPRGVSKEKAVLDEWAKDLSPSPELRKWFNHESDRFAEFSIRYQEELTKNVAVAEFLKNTKEQSTITLLYAAKDPKVNHALVLREYLKQKLK